LALIVAVIVVAAAVFVWMVFLPGSKKTAGSTSTTLKTAAAVHDPLGEFDRVVSSIGFGAGCPPPCLVVAMEGQPRI
jgi:hypothetical protein